MRPNPGAKTGSSGNLAPGYPSSTNLQREYTESEFNAAFVLGNYTANNGKNSGDNERPATAPGTLPQPGLPNGSPMKNTDVHDRGNQTRAGAFIRVPPTADHHQHSNNAAQPAASPAADPGVPTVYVPVPDGGAGIQPEQAPIVTSPSRPESHTPQFLHPTNREALVEIAKAAGKITVTLSYAGGLVFVYTLFGITREQNNDSLSEAEKISLEVYYGASSGIANGPMAVVFAVDFKNPFKSETLKEGIVAFTSLALGLLSALTSLAVSYASLDHPYFNKVEWLKYCFVAFFAGSTILTGVDGAKSLINDIDKRLFHAIHARVGKYKPYYEFWDEVEITRGRVAELIRSKNLNYDFEINKQSQEKPMEQFFQWYKEKLVVYDIQKTRTLGEQTKHIVLDYVIPTFIFVLASTVFTPVWLAGTQDGLKKLGWDGEKFAALVVFAAASRIMFYVNSCVRLPGVVSKFLEKLGHNFMSGIFLFALALAFYGSGAGVAELIRDDKNPSLTNNLTAVNNTATAGFGSVADDLFFSSSLLNWLYMTLVNPWAVQCATILTGDLINLRGMLNFIMSTLNAQSGTDVSFRLAMLIYMFKMFRPLSDSLNHEISGQETLYRRTLLTTYYLLVQDPKLNQSCAFSQFDLTQFNLLKTYIATSGNNEFEETKAVLGKISNLDNVDHKQIKLNQDEINLLEVFLKKGNREDLIQLLQLLQSPPVLLRPKNPDAIPTDQKFLADSEKYLAEFGAVLRDGEVSKDDVKLKGSVVLSHSTVFRAPSIVADNNDEANHRPNFSAPFLPRDEGSINRTRPLDSGLGIGGYGAC